MAMRRWVPIVPRGESVADAADRRLAELTALAIEAFGDHERARRWLRRPRREFGGAAPLDMVETPAAARQVEALLRQRIAQRPER